MNFITFFLIHVHRLVFIVPTKLASPPTLVTRCYVPHFHHYGDISIEILQLKKVMKIMNTLICE